MSMAHGNNYDYHRTTFDGERNERCVCCVRTMKWFPVLFIASVIGWSYYAFVIQLSFFTVTNIVQRILFLLFYHGVLVMFLWSYYQTVFTDIGRVPSRFRVPRAELDRIVRATNEEEQKQILESFAKELPVVTRTLNATVRFCDKCRLIKPDRAHHCSVCGVCVLKLDHHCPWVNNCINFTNYKYFILFLGYALLYCLYVACSTIPYMELLWTGKIDGRFHILFLFFVSIMFAISLVSLFGYHVYLVLLNRTTLESFRTPIFRYGGPDKNGFSLGKLNNFQEVFGDDWRLWFVPVYTSLGDGILFPTQSHHLASNSPHEVGSPVAPLTAITGGNQNYNGAVANGTVGVDVPQLPQTIVLEHVDETKDGGGHRRLELSTNGTLGLQETKESLASSQPLYMGDGVVYPMRCYDEDAEALLGGEQQHNRGATENLHDFEAATFLNEYGNLMH